jgi:hypothetical protein
MIRNELGGVFRRFQEERHFITDWMLCQFESNSSKLLETHERFRIRPMSLLSLSQPSQRTGEIEIVLELLSGFLYSSARKYLT